MARRVKFRCAASRERAARVPDVHGDVGAGELAYRRQVDDGRRGSASTTAASRPREPDATAMATHTSRARSDSDGSATLAAA